MKLIHAAGEPVEQQVMVPFELVTPDNMQTDARRN